MLSESFENTVRREFCSRGRQFGAEILGENCSPSKSLVSVILLSEEKKAYICTRTHSYDWSLIDHREKNAWEPGEEAAQVQEHAVSLAQILTQKVSMSRFGVVSWLLELLFLEETFIELQWLVTKNNNNKRSMSRHYNWVHKHSDVR